MKLFKRKERTEEEKARRRELRSLIVDGLSVLTAFAMLIAAILTLVGWLKPDAVLIQGFVLLAMSEIFAVKR